jgi:hypothetical protein
MADRHNLFDVARRDGCLPRGNVTAVGLSGKYRSMGKAAEAISVEADRLSIPGCGGALGRSTKFLRLRCAAGVHPSIVTLGFGANAYRESRTFWERQGEGQLIMQALDRPKQGYELWSA